MILNHDEEVRTDALGVTAGLARSYEFRLGASAMPWPGGIVEQTIPGNAVTVRAGIDETSYGGCITLRRRPLQLDVAYVYDLGRARVGNLFGTTSNSVLATLTFDMTWRPMPPVVAPLQSPPTAPAR